MSLSVELDEVTMRFGATVAVDAVSARFRAGAITGLLGRNGAGKTTLLSAIAGFRRVTDGSVRVDGRDPYEDPEVMSQVCLVRSTGDLDDGMTVGDALEVADALRPTWDAELAARFVDRFELPMRTKLGKLSTGARSACAVTIGMASRAPLTIFDEPHLGMDAPARYEFYDALLADYATHPRTFVISTHLIDEIAALLEDVVVLHEGRVLLHDTSDELRAAGAELTGPADAVAALAGSFAVLSTRRLGNTAATVVHGDLSDEMRAEAHRRGVDVTPLPLQDLFVHLTGRADPTGTAAPTRSEEATP